ncbi:MAG: hypothetical protein IJ280_00845 [Bacteroidales bacterium]|nr:hypothetical protein [Bacteroidales bacterium]
MHLSREQIEKELQGYYRTGCFHIYLKGSFREDLENMSFDDLSTFTHEYVHYLQNISTFYGIFEANTIHQAAIETFREIETKQKITIPYNTSYSEDLLERLRWINVMNGDRVPEEGCQDIINEDYKISFFFEDYYGQYRNGRKVRVQYKTIDGIIKNRYIGALDIKEGMAVAYQSILGELQPHPDIPYNLLRILCKQHFPSVYNDVKKFICICYTSLFDLSPADFFMSLCLDDRVDNTKSGFQVFDDFIWTSPIKVKNKSVNVPYFFNQTIETFKESIKGFLRIDTPYIDTILDSVKLVDGNVPILNVINTEAPITVENIKALVKVTGIPFIHAQGRGWFFPSLNGQGASDIVHMVGLTWIHVFLLQQDKAKQGICPFATICGMCGDYCFDKPWLEDYEKCIFKLITKDLKIRDKFM